MTQLAPPFAPRLNFFGSTISEGDRDIFAGHLYFQGNEAGFPGRRIATANLNLPRLQGKEKPRGRPSKVAEYITLLAHCEMAEKLVPAGTSVREIRRNALQAIYSEKMHLAEKMARDQVENGGGRLLQIHLKNASEAVSSMRKCVCMSKSDQTGFWLAVERLPVERDGVLMIDSPGWLCFAGGKAEYGGIRWEAPAVRMKAK